MTQTLPDSTTPPGVTIRSYRPSDHNACRRLWAELDDHRADLTNDRSIRTDDPGAGFEEYLTQLTLSGMWVAQDGDSEVVGFVGLRLDGRLGEVDPIVVTESMRGRGIGQALLAAVAEQARRRGLRQLTVSPPLRDVAALRALRSAGFDTATVVTLSLSLARTQAHAATPETSGPGTIDLDGVRFRI